MFLHGFGEDGVTSGDIIEDMHGKRYAVGVWAKASNGYYLKGQKEKSIFCKNDVEMTKAAKKLKLWFCLEFGLKSIVFKKDFYERMKACDLSFRT